jgi:antitoxin (DNA-binding transcriptional repressor) of toxin-antitoxin stability system
MIVVGVREAKDRMYQLIELARAGEEVIITRRGKPVAKLEVLSPERATRLPETRGGG